MMDQSYLFQIDDQTSLQNRQHHRNSKTSSSPSSKTRSSSNRGPDSLDVSFTDSEASSSMVSESESSTSYLAPFSKIQGKQITQRLLNRLLDLRNVTFFRQHFSVALVPYIRETEQQQFGSSGVQLPNSPRVEVAQNCLLNIEQVVFKTFTNHYNSTGKDQTMILTGMPCEHFFNAVPRIIASTLNYLNAPKASTKFASQLSVLAKIGTYEQGGKFQSTYGLRVNVKVNSNSEYTGHEVFAPLLQPLMHFWELPDTRVMENVSKFPVFACLFNAPTETLLSLLGSSFMKRHGNWIKSHFQEPEQFNTMVNDLHSALNLSTMERSQFLKLVSLVILLLDTENIFLEIDQASTQPKTKAYNDRIRKYILSLPLGVLEEICNLFGPSTDKYTLVSKIGNLSKVSGQSKFYSSLAQYIHRALFNWVLSKIQVPGRGLTEEHCYNFVWLPQSYQFLETNVAVEHIHAWAVRYLCEIEEVSMKNEGFTNFQCSVWKTHGCACQIVEQFMNGHLDVKTLSQKFTINHSFGPVLYATPGQKKFSAEELVKKLRELLPLKLLTSTPHFCHIMFLDRSPLESTEMLQNEISKSFLKMVCDVDDASYPHKIPLDKFRLNYLPKLLFISKLRNVSLETILTQYIPKEEFLIGSHSVLLKNSGYMFLDKLITKSMKSAVVMIENAFVQYKQRRSLSLGLKKFLKDNGIVIATDQNHTGHKIKKWWRGISSKREERKWAATTIENFWVMCLARRRIRACVSTIEDWWIKVKEKRSRRLYWLDMAVRIIQKNMRIFMFKKKLAKRIQDKKQKMEQTRRERLENMEMYEQQWKESPLYNQQDHLTSSSNTFGSMVNRAKGIRSLRPPDKLLQLMDNPLRHHADFRGDQMPMSDRPFFNSQHQNEFRMSSPHLGDSASDIPDIPEGARQDEYGNLIIPRSIVDEFLRTSKRDRSFQQLEWRTHFSPKKMYRSPDMARQSPHNDTTHDSNSSIGGSKPTITNISGSSISDHTSPIKRDVENDDEEDYSYDSFEIPTLNQFINQSDQSHQSNQSNQSNRSEQSSNEAGKDEQNTSTKSEFSYSNLLDQVFNGGKEPPIVHRNKSTSARTTTREVNKPPAQKSKKFTSSSSSTLFMRVYGYEPGLSPPVGKAAATRAKPQQKPTTTTTTATATMSKSSDAPFPQRTIGPKRDTAPKFKPPTAVATTKPRSTTPVSSRPVQLRQDVHRQRPIIGQRGEVSKIIPGQTQKLLSTASDMHTFKKKPSSIKGGGALSLGEWEEQVDAFISHYQFE